MELITTWPEQITKSRPRSRVLCSNAAGTLTGPTWRVWKNWWPVTILPDSRSQCDVSVAYTDGSFTYTDGTDEYSDASRRGFRPNRSHSSTL